MSLPNFIPERPTFHGAEIPFVLKGWLQTLWKYIRNVTVVATPQTATFNPDFENYYYPITITSSSVVVTLPPAADCMGKQYVFELTSTVTGTAALITVTAGDTSAGSNTILRVVGDTITCISDGISKWYLYKNGTIVNTAIINQAYSATTTIDLTDYAAYGAVVINMTLTGNITFDITGGTEGQVVRVWFTQDSTGSRTFTAGANLRFSTDVPSPTLSTAANKIDTLGFQCRSVDSKVWLVAVVKGF